MSGWQVGDLALCKRNGEWTAVGGNMKPFDGGPQGGQIFAVTGLFTDPQFLVLKFNEYPGWAFRADRFHRIPPHQFDEEDLETVSLMKRAPAPAVQQ